MSHLAYDTQQSSARLNPSFWPGDDLPYQYRCRTEADSPSSSTFASFRENSLCSISSGSRDGSLSMPATPLDSHDFASSLFDSGMLNFQLKPNSPLLPASAPETPWLTHAFPIGPSSVPRSSGLQDSALMANEFMQDHSRMLGSQLEIESISIPAYMNQAQVHKKPSRLDLQASEDDYIKNFNPSSFENSVNSSNIDFFRQNCHNQQSPGADQWSITPGATMDLNPLHTTSFNTNQAYRPKTFEPDQENRSQQFHRFLGTSNPTSLLSRRSVASIPAKIETNRVNMRAAGLSTRQSPTTLSVRKSGPSRSPLREVFGNTPFESNNVPPSPSFEITQNMRRIDFQVDGSENHFASHSLERACSQDLNEVPNNKPSYDSGSQNQQLMSQTILCNPQPTAIQPWNSDVSSFLRSDGDQVFSKVDQSKRTLDEINYNHNINLCDDLLSKDLSSGIIWNNQDNCKSFDRVSEWSYTLDHFDDRSFNLSPSECHTPLTPTSFSQNTENEELKELSSGKKSDKSRKTLSGGVKKSKDKNCWTCDFHSCGKEFYRFQHLQRHIRSVHSFEKPFECLMPGCTSKFSRKDNLTQHHRQVHAKISNSRRGSLKGIENISPPS